MTIVQTYRRMFTVIAFTSSLLFATACRDETVRKTGEAAEAAGEDIEAGAEKAVEKTKEAGREIREEVGPGLERAGKKLQEKGAELRKEVTTTAPDAGAPAPRK